MSKPEEYGVCIRLIRQDDVELYEGRVNELADLKVYGETYSEAYEELVEAIGTAQSMFAEQGRAFPHAEPSEESFSGRVTLRMSKSLHRHVHEKAGRDGVSLNQWIVEAIGYRVSSNDAASGLFYVMSPMRQANSDAVTMCVQPATHLTTRLTTTGSMVSLLSTPGVMETYAPSLLRADTQHWRI